MAEISQEELNSLNIEVKNDVVQDVENLIILIRNELNILESSVGYYDEKKHKAVKRKLNKLLNGVIDIRKV